ncbi:hypothetical protein CAGGBEG34_840001 [Candidatus Glomeribacter gigasporarum BEG34]|uniref:Uncharacterized protein n=2 Tax=cellular organisms TaxID=131567 RepID=G2JC22_9BURK|nr:hypothetical protein [Candidatus Glomeribacter gigasporarum]CCD30328.1 hypothetical protein CAGGBEG34_840001 [Candidatus Glomeribacter gigasporarum BEG34]
MDSDTQRGARHAPFDEESMFALLVKAIKRFLARLCQGFAPISSSPVRSSDASGPMSVNMSAASVLSGAQDEREETPAPTLASVRHSACERVERAADNSLRHSLEAALALPPLECRHALRALLQQNFSDSHRIREACTALTHHLEAEIAPFAAEHPLTSASALAIFRAGLDHQDGAIAAQVDAHYALRSMTTELKRLESALADLTHARTLISAGAYTREALAAMIAQQSFDSAFLFQAETAKPAQAHPAPTRIDIQNEAPADAVSGRHLFGLDTGVQADELDVFFKHSAPQNTHALKKEPRPHLRARS